MSCNFMSNWIFCNWCLEVQKESRRKCFVTSCDHVFCEFCFGYKTNFCHLCQNQCNSLEINKRLPSDLRMLFEDNAINKLGETVGNIRNFRENQMKLYHENQENETGPKYYQSKQEVNASKDKLKDIVHAMQNEKNMIVQLKDVYKTNVEPSDLFKLASNASKALRTRQMQAFPGPYSLNSRQMRSYQQSIASSSSSIANLVERLDRTTVLTRNSYTKEKDAQNKHKLHRQVFQTFEVPDGNKQKTRRFKACPHLNKMF